MREGGAQPGTATFALAYTYKFPSEAQAGQLKIHRPAAAEWLSAAPKDANTSVGRA